MNRNHRNHVPTTDWFAERLLAWHRAAGRHDLPWQADRTPYRVWLSEIMLQQTQVATVIPYYQRFIERFPDLSSLARADLDEVLGLWSGLGYYSRARNLHRCAREVVARHDGRLPEILDELVALPGIGRSTAAAILAFSTGRRHAILDGNVKRVLCRFHAIEGWPGQAATNRRLWALAEAHTPEDDVAAYTQAIMDLGATLCRRHRPGCPSCPVADRCQAWVLGRVGDYPTPRPRRRIPERRTVMPLLTGPSGILLERRPASGVWGGLWSLPEYATDDTDGEGLADWCRTRYGLETGRIAVGTEFTHVFSHYRLRIQPVFVEVTPLQGRIMEGRETLWYTPTRHPDCALPAPIRRLLEAATDAPCFP